MQSTPRTYQQLQPEESVTLASLAQQKYGVGQMAEVLRRLPSTISRELRGNRGPQGYASEHVHEQSAERRKSARLAIKLHAEALLFDVVCHFLRLLWSSEQIALPLTHSGNALTFRCCQK